MEDENVIQSPTVTLSALKATVKNEAVKSAIVSLAAWGAITLGAWYLLASDQYRFILEGLSFSTAVKILLYGGVIMGSVMLSFAGIGAITKGAFTVLLAALSLVAVGGWNLCYDTFASLVLRTHGYHVKINAIWCLLGIGQLLWGLRHFGDYGRVLSWADAKCTPTELESVKRDLTSLSMEPENIERGRIRATIAMRRFVFVNTTVQFFGWFSGDHLILVSTGMDDFLLIAKPAASKATFGTNGSMSVSTSDRSDLTLTLGDPSIQAIKQWCKDAADS